jgi:hypothetical protein
MKNKKDIKKEIEILLEDKILGELNRVKKE